MSSLIKFKFYWHSSKENSDGVLMELGEEHDVSHINPEDFIWTGSEVHADVEIGSDGRVFATHFMGKKLEEKVEI